MQSWRDGLRVRHPVVRPNEAAVCELERGTVGPARRGLPLACRRVQRAVERTEPATIPRLIANRRNDEQVARARGRYVREADSFGSIPQHFFGLVFVQIV